MTSVQRAMTTAKNAVFIGLFSGVNQGINQTSKKIGVCWNWEFPKNLPPMGSKQIFSSSLLPIAKVCQENISE